MEQSVVDREIEVRMTAGFTAKFGVPPERDELKRLYNLARLALMNPLVNTFSEIDEGIKKITSNYKPARKYASK